MRVLLVQEEPVPGDRAANAETVAAALAASPEADLAVLPELFLDGYDATTAPRTASSADEAASTVADAAAAHGTAVILGFAERLSDGAVANSLAIVDADGALRAVYRKTHLFGGPERAAFRPGDELLVVDLAGRRIAPLVCFDVEFPEPARAAAVAGADLLVTAAANMAPYAEDHRLAARARALDNRLPHVYVNRVGREAGHAFVGGSCVVGADGRVLASADDGDLMTPGPPAQLLVEVPAAIAGDPDTDYLRHRRDRLPVRVHPTNDAEASA